MCVEIKMLLDIEAGRILCSNNIISSHEIVAQIQRRSRLCQVINLENTMFEETQLVMLHLFWKFLAPENEFESSRKILDS